MTINLGLSLLVHQRLTLFIFRRSVYSLPVNTGAANGRKALWLLCSKLVMIKVSLFIVTGAN